MYIYYVYAYIRNKESFTAKAGTPYYIGKGKGGRAWQKHRSNIPVPDDRYVVLLETGLTEIGALAIERRMIQWYGRKNNKTGILINLTDGGDGASGAIRSQKFKENIAKKMTGRFISDETRKKLSEAHKGIKLGPMSDEHKNRISKQLKGRVVKASTILAWHRTTALRKLSGIAETPRKIKQVTCPRCFKVGGGGNMTRYHFKNCKHG